MSRCGALGWDRIHESFTCDLTAGHDGDHGAQTRDHRLWFSWAPEILTPTLFP